MTIEKPYNIVGIKKEIANNVRSIKNTTELLLPHINIKKAIVFPINKESHAILRFKHQLNFEIVGVYDERLLGKVGKEKFGKAIQSYDSIDWDADFDTIILSCISELSDMTKRDYRSEILKNAMRHGKQIYSFEDLESDYEKIFYPHVSEEMLPCQNLHKLHKVLIPVIGVFGTSSKQGKFTLQQHLIAELSNIGYNVGFISTEPSGYLFNADFVFHCGYNSNVAIDSKEYISVLNEMIWKIQLNGKDVVITGGQSGVVNYNDSHMNDYSISQYSFLLGVAPDVSILCVNPHDDVDYIQKSINFINAICEGQVQAIVIFPLVAAETLSGIGYKINELSDQELEKAKVDLNGIFGIPTFSLRNKVDLKALCTILIDKLSGEENSD